MDNSIDCRAWHSQVAVTTAPQAHCFHAAPQGGGFCGTACQNLCDNVMAVCTGSLVQWNSWAQCNATCAYWTGQTTFLNASNPTTSGNSLPCRKYHASVAGTSPSLAQVHCIHTGVLGGSGTCGLACDGICSIVGGVCPSISNCATTCGALNASSSTTQDILGARVPKGSVGCSAYYALLAVNDPTQCSNIFSSSQSACMSGATLLKASWAIIALIFLALGVSY